MQIASTQPVINTPHLLFENKEVNRYSPGVFSPLGSDPTSPWSDFSTIRLGRLHIQLSIIIAIKSTKITYRLIQYETEIMLNSNL